MFPRSSDSFNFSSAPHFACCLTLLSQKQQVALSSKTHPKTTKSLSSSPTEKQHVFWHFAMKSATTSLYSISNTVMLFYVGTMELIQGCTTLRVCATRFSPLSKSRPWLLQTAAFSLAAHPDTQRRITSHRTYNIQVGSAIRKGERQTGEREGNYTLKRGNISLENNISLFLRDVIQHTDENSDK